MIDNSYNALADVYQSTDIKPDKKYSILPTVIMLAGDLNKKTVLDLGCGSGFFTRHFAVTAGKVIGIDNSNEQIERAKQTPTRNTEYILADVFKDDLPTADVVSAPFILGYCADAVELKSFFTKVYRSLKSGGRFLGVIDVPMGEDSKKYGATKILHGEKDGSRIEIILSDGSTTICTLWATYFSASTIQSLLAQTGFQNITWHKPIVSGAGLKEMPHDYWNGYIERCELGYFTAAKK